MYIKCFVSCALWIKWLLLLFHIFVWRFDWVFCTSGLLETSRRSLPSVAPTLRRTLTDLKKSFVRNLVKHIKLIKTRQSHSLIGSQLSRRRNVIQECKNRRCASFSLRFHLCCNCIASFFGYETNKAPEKQRETSLNAYFRNKLRCKKQHVKNNKCRGRIPFRIKHRYCTKAAYLDERSASQPELQRERTEIRTVATSDMHKYSIKIQYGKIWRGLVRHVGEM